MQNSYKIISYKVKHNYDIKEFLYDYQSLLQKAIDTIWNNISWIKKGKRLLPKLPNTREFKKNLRNSLLENWNYASHYVDSSIRVAYSILKSWRRNYIKGRAKREKPIVKKLFVRVKETLYVYRDGKIRITIIPWKQYLEFDLTKAWFKNRVKGLELGELILRENELIITFRKPIEEKNYTECIGWDLNLFSLDGFSPKYGWIRVDLSELYHIHRAHEIKRRKAQSVASKKNSVRLIVTNHGCRERNRAKDFVHKLTTELARIFPNAIHGFEDLSKNSMYNNSKKHNREIAKQNWKQIVKCMSYKSEIKLVNPKNTSSTCPQCGGKMKLRKGQVKCTKCNLELNRQLCGAINIYLRMCGFPQSPSSFFRLVLRPLARLMKKRKVALMKTLGRVTTNGDKGNDMLSMNSRGWLSLMNPKAYRGLKTYVS